MPLDFVESFDHFSTAQATEKWTDFGVATISVGGGRNGSNAANNASIGTMIDQAIATPQDAEWILAGCAYNHNSPSSDIVMAWKDLIGTVLGFVVADLSGSFSIWRGVNTTLGTRIGTTRPTLWHASEWFYLESRVHLLSSGLGEVHIYVNGMEELAATLVQTIEVGATQPWRLASFFARGRMEDIYAAHEGGLVDASDVSTVGTNLGDIHIENLMAVPDSTAPGTFQDFTPSAGGDHGAMVDENLPGNDADTTYNSAFDPEEIDTYRFNTVSSITTGLVHGVQFNPTVRKEGIGTRIIRNLTRSGGVNFGGRPIGLPVDYFDHWECREADPATGAKWLIPAVDAVEQGIQLQVATDNALPDEGGPAPGAGQPPPDGAAPGGYVRPAPAEGTFRPIIESYAAANPSQLANSCQNAGGTWDFMDGVLAALRAVDSNWGYNGKRGNLNDPSHDVFAYYGGPGAPYTGALETYVIDIITGHCGPSPSVGWIDQTMPNVLGAWLQSR